MLVNQTQQRTFSGVSAIDVSEGKGTPIAYMNANYNGKDLNFSQNIQNYTLYSENKTEVDADYESFKEFVISAIS